MGETTKFCGRILLFLSSVFPLGERSGVNLRGEFGPVWDGPGLKKEGEEKIAEEVKEGEDEKMKEAEGEGGEGEKMQIDEEKAERVATTPEAPQQKDSTDGMFKCSISVTVLFTSIIDFYNVFWSMQFPFSRPPLFAEPQTLPQFKEAVAKVLPVIKEATARERALMGSKSSGLGSASLKRKREPEAVPQVAGKEYFFAKYLTSPDLLELEVTYNLYALESL